jgi:hypothetical protein
MEIMEELKNLRDNFTREQKHQLLLELGYKLKVVRVTTDAGALYRRGCTVTHAYPYYYTEVERHASDWTSLGFKESLRLTLLPGKSSDRVGWMEPKDAKFVFADILAPVEVGFDNEESCFEALNNRLKNGSRL